jgi:hypothetical protein
LPRKSVIRDPSLSTIALGSLKSQNLINPSLKIQHPKYCQRLRVFSETSGIPGHSNPDFKMVDSSNLQRWTVTEPYLNIHCALGEGPYYEPAANQLRFVDIKNKRLHSFDLSVGPSSLKTLQLDTPVGITADIEGVDPQKKILIGGKTGLAVLDRESGKYRYLTRFYDGSEGDDRLRSNDGTVDSHGRMWIGTMNDFHVGQPQPEGESITVSRACRGFSYVTKLVVLIKPCSFLNSNLAEVL